MSLKYGDKVRIINTNEFWDGLEGIVISWYTKGLSEDEDGLEDYYSIKLEHSILNDVTKKMLEKI